MPAVAAGWGRGRFLRSRSNQVGPHGAVVGVDGADRGLALGWVDKSNHNLALFCEATLQQRANPDDAKAHSTDQGRSRRGRRRLRAFWRMETDPIVARVVAVS